MGMHQSTYMGAYVLVPFAQQPCETTSHVCSAVAKHTIAPGARFCSNCGAAVISAKTQELKPMPVLAHNIGSGEFEGRFFTPEGGIGRTHSLWLPNTLGYGETLRADCSPDELEDLDPSYFVLKKNALKTNNAALFEQLEAQFGVVARVQAGVLSYWS